METKISLEETSEVTRSIHFEIPKELYQQNFEKALGQAASKANIKGFRKGRVPKAMVIKMFGEAIHRDVMGDLVNEAYKTALQTHELHVVGEPKVNTDEEDNPDGLKFTADVDIFPEPKIEDYQGLEVEAVVESEEPSEEQLEGMLDELRVQHATVESVVIRTASKEKDVLTIDFSGTVDGESFEGSQGAGVTVELGVGGVPEEFEKGLLDMEVGSARDIEVAFPEDAQNKELAGKTVVYHVTLTAISEKVKPQLDDEFAKKTKLAEDLEGLKEHMKDTKRKQVAEGNKRAREDAFFKALAEKNSFDVPEALVDQEIREILFEMGILNRQKEESYGIDVSKFRESLGEGADFRVRRYVMLESVIRQEALEVDDGNVAAWVDKQAEDLQRPAAEIKKAFGLPKNVEMLKKMIAREKMLEQLMEGAVVTEVPAEDKKSEDSEEKPKKASKKKTSKTKKSEE